MYPFARTDNLSEHPVVDEDVVVDDAVHLGPHLSSGHQADKRKWTYSPVRLLSRWLIEPCARKVFIFWTLVEREEHWGAIDERWREHVLNLATLETASELKKLLTIILSSRRLYKPQAKIICHVVY